MNVEMWMRCACVILFIGATSGCTARDAAPELRDPVFLSLNTEVLSAGKSLEDSVKEAELSRSEIEKSESITGTARRVRIEKLFKSESAARLAQQRVDYLTARRMVRQREDRLGYNLAVNQGLPWPAPGELAAYESSRTISQRSRNYTQVHEERLKKLAPARAPASKESAPAKE
jgi:hypothetical protein